MRARLPRRCGYRRPRTPAADATLGKVPLGPPDRRDRLPRPTPRPPPRRATAAASARSSVREPTCGGSRAEVTEVVWGDLDDAGGARPRGAGHRRRLPHRGARQRRRVARRVRGDERPRHRGSPRRRGDRAACVASSTSARPASTAPGRARPDHRVHPARPADRAPRRLRLVEGRVRPAGARLRGAQRAISTVVIVRPGSSTAPRRRPSSPACTSPCRGAADAGVIVGSRHGAPPADARRERVRSARSGSRARTARAPSTTSIDGDTPQGEYLDLLTREGVVDHPSDLRPRSPCRPARAGLRGRRPPLGPAAALDAATASSARPRASATTPAPLATSSAGLRASISRPGVRGLSAQPTAPTTSLTRASRRRPSPRSSGTSHERLLLRFRGPYRRPDNPAPSRRTRQVVQWRPRRRATTPSAERQRHEADSASLFVIDELDIGGTEQQIVELVRAHRPRPRSSPTSAASATARKAKEIEALGVPVLHEPKRAEGRSGARPAARRVMRRERFDIVQTYLWTANTWGAPRGPPRRRPLRRRLRAQRRHLGGDLQAHARPLARALDRSHHRQLRGGAALPR